MLVHMAATLSDSERRTRRRRITAWIYYGLALLTMLTAFSVVNYAAIQSSRDDTIACIARWAEDDYGKREVRNQAAKDVREAQKWLNAINSDPARGQDELEKAQEFYDERAKVLDKVQARNDYLPPSAFCDDEEDR